MLVNCKILVGKLAGESGTIRESFIDFRRPIHRVVTSQGVIDFRAHELRITGMSMSPDSNFGIDPRHPRPHTFRENSR